MDAGDQDLGSSGLTLLDPSVFHGTGVARIAVTAGKNGKIYVLNADNLGGYKMGPGMHVKIIIKVFLLYLIIYQVRLMRSYKPSLPTHLCLVDLDLIHLKVNSYLDFY